MTTFLPSPTYILFWLHSENKRTAIEATFSVRSYHSVSQKTIDENEAADSNRDAVQKGERNRACSVPSERTNEPTKMISSDRAENGTVEQHRQPLGVVHIIFHFLIYIHPCERLRCLESIHKFV